MTWWYILFTNDVKLLLTLDRNDWNDWNKSYVILHKLFERHHIPKKNDSFRGQQRSLIISWLYCDVFQIFHFGDIKPIEKIIYYGDQKWFWFHRKTARVCFTDRQISISLQLTQAYDKYLIKETWRIEKIWNANSFLRLNFFEKPAFLSFHT